MSQAVKTVLVMGLGLIGGSLAKSLKRTGFCGEVRGWGHRDVSLKKGVEQGVIDGYSLDMDEALEGCDIVVIGTPTLVAGELLGEVMARAGRDAVVTDVASVKGGMVEAYREARGRLGGDDGNNELAAFVPGHPIAGSERSGVDAADAELFVNHRAILTPIPETDAAALKLVRSMWESAGAEVVELGVDEHDAILAATSHLPHVLAYALVDALAHSDLSADIFRFAAGGFRDFTRIASSDPVMWRDIALANRGPLLEAMDSFGEHLAALRRAVAEGDGEAITEIFAAAKTIRDAFANGPANNAAADKRGTD